MSKIKVNRIENTATTDGGVDIDATGHVTLDGLQMPTAGALSNRNLIINGAMQVAQRATSATIQDGANEGYRALDRWRVLFSNSAGGVATMSQDTTVPNKEFTSSLKIDVTTTDTSFEDDNQAITIQYRFEGKDIANSGWDYSSSSSYLNVSFWAKSNKAGTYCVFLYAQDGTKHSNVKEYTLAANTWQFVSVAYPGNSGLSFDNDNGGSLYVGWTLQAAPNRYAGVTPGQWKDSSTSIGYYATSNQVNFFDSTDNNWYLTGVQIEVGSKATPFEHRSFGDELARCQRYYTRSYDYGTASGTATNAGALATSAYAQIGYASAGLASFKVTMRATPSITVYGTSGVLNKVSADSVQGTAGLSFIGMSSCEIHRDNDNSGVGPSTFMRAHYLADAEL